MTTTTENPVIDQAERKAAIQRERDERDRPHYQIAYDYIKANALKGRSSFKIAAKLINVSPYHFHRTFTRLFKITPKQLAASVQIEAAKEMMLKNVPLVDIARLCGFAHQSHMNARFRQLENTSPGLWLRDEKTRRNLESNK